MAGPLLRIGTGPTLAANAWKANMPVGVINTVNLSAIQDAITFEL